MVWISGAILNDLTQLSKTLKSADSAAAQEWLIDYARVYHASYCFWVQPYRDGH